MNRSAQNISDFADALHFSEQISAPIGEKFIVFNLGDELFAVSAGKVSEVVQPLEITALPNVPEWILGICNLRGEIISVINLPKLWQTKIPVNFTKSKLIILRNESSTIAIAVNRLSEIISLPEEFIEPCGENSHFYAKALIDSKNLRLIDADNLLSAISLSI